MMSAMTYRGHRLECIKDAADEPTPLWTIDQTGSMVWNEALAYVDAIATVDEPAPHHICKVCGLRDLMNWNSSTVKELRATGLCHGCNFWNHWYESAEKDKQVDPVSYFVADGVAYHIAATYRGAGHGGRKFGVRWPSGFERVTENLWCQGRISWFWRKKLPDTAAFITG
jgi:hypothetical protein